MKVFISQSRERSRAVALELQKFVRKLVPSTDPWVSSTGIEKGSRWGTELAESLEKAAAGIICLASDNLEDRWIHFEAGALSRQPKDKVWTFLLDVDHAQVEPPLAQFQHTKPEKEDVWQMIESINRTASEKLQRQNNDLREIFDVLWPAFDKRMTEIREMAVATARPTRSTTDLLEEVLGHVRLTAQRTDEVASALPKLLLKIRPPGRIEWGRGATPGRIEWARGPTVDGKPADDEMAWWRQTTDPASESLITELAARVLSEARKEERLSEQDLDAAAEELLRRDKKKPAGHEGAS